MWCGGLTATSGTCRVCPVGAGARGMWCGAIMAARVALLSYLRRGVLQVVHLRSKDKLCPSLLEQGLVSLRNVVCF